MRELNPQLSDQLRELAVSPGLVATLGVFRAGCNVALRNRMISTAENLQNFPAGQQVLVLFKCDRIAAAPLSSLDTARKLLAEHKALCKESEK